MSENKKYTIVVKKNRIEVSKDVYYAYHKDRETERYQNKQIHQYELSLDCFQKEGVNVEYAIVRFEASIEDKLIMQDQLSKLWLILRSLPKEEQFLIQELFFSEKSERKLAVELGVPRMTLNDQKHRIFNKIRKSLES